MAVSKGDKVLIGGVLILVGSVVAIFGLGLIPESVLSERWWLLL